MRRIWKRADPASVLANNSTLRYQPSVGSWSNAVDDGNTCAQSAKSTISPGSSVTLTFVGTSLSVNVLKNSNGAPYTVALDGQFSSFDSYSTSEGCGADFSHSNLDAKQHTVSVTHTGNSSMAALGRSTLEFVSFQYTPSANSQSGASKSSGGAIAGGVIGGLVVVALGIAIWWFVRRRRRTRETGVIKGGEVGVGVEQRDPNLSPYVIDPTPNSDPNSDATLIASRRNKASEASSNPRYHYNSPWASLTSQNRSHNNLVGTQEGSSSYADSAPPMNIHNYPPGSATEGTEIPEDSSLSSPRATGVFQNQYHNPMQFPQPNRSYPSGVPAPSILGESVLIDSSDYVPPPSYSPPPVQRPTRQTSKAAYQGTSSGYNTTSLSSGSSNRMGQHSPSQTLSQSDIDRIARTVVDMMRSQSSQGGSSAAGSTTGPVSDVSSSDAANPQVQQAVRMILDREDPRLLHQSYPPEKR